MCINNYMSTIKSEIKQKEKNRNTENIALQLVFKAVALQTVTNELRYLCLYASNETVTSVIN